VAYCCGSPTSTIKYGPAVRTLPQPVPHLHADTDMTSTRCYRDEMIRYAAEKYGRNTVAQIVTFSTIKDAPGARRAACWATRYMIGDRIAKAMPPLIMGRDTPLKACLRAGQRLRAATRWRRARAMYEDRAGLQARHGCRQRASRTLPPPDGIPPPPVVITKEEPDRSTLRPTKLTRAGSGTRRWSAVEMHASKTWPAEDGLSGCATSTSSPTPSDHQQTRDVDSTSTPCHSTTTRRSSCCRRGRHDGCSNSKWADARAHPLRSRRPVSKTCALSSRCIARSDGGEHAQRLRGTGKTAASRSSRCTRISKKSSATRTT